LSIGKSGVTSLGFEGRGEGIPMGFIFVFQGSLSFMIGLLVTSGLSLFMLRALWLALYRMAQESHGIDEVDFGDGGIAE